MKEKLQRFMAGRYGVDELTRFGLFVTLALMILSMFIRNNAPYLLALVLLVYCYYRMLSRNIAKRQREVQRFRSIRYRAAVKWNAYKAQREQKKIYRFYSCPQCKQKVRVPKGKGRICITCPKCRTEFVKKS